MSDYRNPDRGGHAVALHEHDLGTGFGREELDAPGWAHRQWRGEPARVDGVEGVCVGGVRVHDLGANHAIERAPAVVEDRRRVVDRLLELACHSARYELAVARIATGLSGHPDHPASYVGVRIRASRLRASPADDSAVAHQASEAMQSIWTFAPFHRNATPKLVRAGSGSWKRAP